MELRVNRKMKMMKMTMMMKAEGGTEQMASTRKN
jgi:hypothetical protein